MQTRLFRGRRSRNKVSVGEPAEGSFACDPEYLVHISVWASSQGWRLYRCPWGVSSKVAEVAVGVLATFCSATVTTNSLLFILEICPVWLSRGPGPSWLLLLLHLSAMDVWARTSMKGAAKCDERCELQNSVNQ